MDIKQLTPAQINELIAAALEQSSMDELSKLSSAALRMKRLKADGIAADDPEIIKLATAANAIAMKHGINPAKVGIAMGRNFSPAVYYRSYKADAGKTSKGRPKKT